MRASKPRRHVVEMCASAVTITLAITALTNVKKDTNIKFKFYIKSNQIKFINAKGPVGH